MSSDKRNKNKRLEEVKSTDDTRTKIIMSGEEYNSWLINLYDVTKLSDTDIINMYEQFRYKGFDREEIIKQLFQITKGDTKLCFQLILICALQGPQRASKTKLSNGLSPAEMGIPASGQQSTSKISCQRIVAATADMAAYLMKKISVPKRLFDHALPGWLQFPSAGAIRLPQNLRDLHIDFHRKFSVLIGGIFRDDIYSQMVSNSYYDAKLRLFDE
jgi:hypothetical protein